MNADQGYTKSESQFRISRISSSEYVRFYKRSISIIYESLFTNRCMKGQMYT